MACQSAHLDYSSTAIQKLPPLPSKLYTRDISSILDLRDQAAILYDKTTALIPPGSVATVIIGQYGTRSNELCFFGRAHLRIPKQFNSLFETREHTREQSLLYLPHLCSHVVRMSAWRELLLPTHRRTD